MQFARVIGTVVSTEKVSAWRGTRLLLIQPCDAQGKPGTARPVVAVDTVSAAPGQLVFYVKGREASTALQNPDNPADAAIIGLVDSVREAPGEMR